MALPQALGVFMILKWLFGSEARPDVPGSSSTTPASSLPAGTAAAPATAAQSQIPATSTATTTQPTTTPNASPAPAPFPQVTPSDLPKFPDGWEPDNPPGSGVSQRAWQLLSQLWAKGAGSTQQEQTAGRWITYQATQMAGGVKGVVAWRVKGSGTAPGTSLTQQASTSTFDATNVPQTFTKSTS